MRAGYGWPAAGLMLLAACEAKIDPDNAAEAAAGNAISAEGKSEEGKISFKGPGFDFSLDVPGGLSRHTGVNRDSEILYPGAAIAGIYIAAGGNDRGEVEIGFNSADPPDKVAAWYRDPARGGHFALSSAAKEGDEFVFAGAEKGDGDRFKLRLRPRSGGGTDGRLVVGDRR
jgi:hypothetical protein